SRPTRAACGATAPWPRAARIPPPWRAPPCVRSLRVAAEGTGRDAVLALDDREQPIGRQVRELLRLAGRPVDAQPLDRRGLREPEMLLERRGAAEADAAEDLAVLRAPARRQVQARADRVAVALRPLQLHAGEVAELR